MHIAAPALSMARAAKQAYAEAVACRPASNSRW